MKKLMYSLILIGFTILMSSCSSIQILDSWKGKNIETIKSKNILVIARTGDKQARIAFEQAIANNLRADGFRATESFLKFPSFSPDKKNNNSAVKNLLNKAGYNGVALTVLKSHSSAVVTDQSGGYYAGGSYNGYNGNPYGGNGYFPGYYGGFYGYYNNPMSYGNYVPSTATTRVEKTYVLETLIYNLDEAEDKQLVGLVTSKTVDPSSVTKLAESYSKKVLKNLEKN